MKLGGRGKRKENDKASTISKYITPVQVEDARICIGWKLLNNRRWRKGVRESNGRG
jgi:hypothetical protein